MSAAPATVKGWCPGVLRPMPSGDGLLVRVRPHGGMLDAQALAVLAQASRDLGNGLADLTSQANLQLRGLTPAGVEVLAHRLRPLGLVDDSAASEARRNIVVSPLGGGDEICADTVTTHAVLAGLVPAIQAGRLSNSSKVDATSRRGWPGQARPRRPNSHLGIEPVAPFNIPPLAYDLALQLRNAGDLDTLPPKFTFLIDAGGPLPLGDVKASIRFEAMPGTDTPRFLVKLCGTSASGEVIGQCTPQTLAAVALSLARRQSPAGLLPVALADIPPPRAVTQADDCLRQFACDDMHYIGALAPFGRLTSAMLAALADIAQRANCPVRLTPWRCVLVPLAAPAQAGGVQQQLADAGFVLTPDDPSARIAACVGAPACTSATTPVRADAAVFGQALTSHKGKGIALHVSGCAKGCAHQKPAPVTLVARAGTYDLVLAGTAQAGAQETGHTRASALMRLHQIFADPESFA